MEKKFFEAFPNLKLEGVQKDLFEQVVVEKITATKRKDLLRVYIRSERLIDKEAVFAVEREIKKQFFSKEFMVIKIYEHFLLSGQYNPQKLMEVYRESILLELKECEHMLYMMFRQAEMAFPDNNTMELVLENSVIAKSKEDQLICILDKVLNERCGFQVRFQVDYKEVQAGKYREDDELRIQKIVEGITSRFHAGSSQEAGAAGQSAKNSASSGTAKAAAAKSFAAEKGAAQGGAVQRGAAQNGAAQKTEKPAGFGSSSADRGWQAKKGEGFQRRLPKKSDNPDVIFGRDFDDEAMNISEIWGEMGEVTIRGKVRTLDKREIRNEKTIVSFEITDFTDTIKVKMFVHNEQLGELLDNLKVGAFLKVKGITVNDMFDRELTIATVVGLKKIPDFTTTRMDNSAKKRVELHCHTKMSDMDGVSDVKDIIKRAKKWGHKAIAITDHGCVQSFPDANLSLIHI